MLGENHYHFGRGIRTNFRNKYKDIISPEVQKILFNQDIIVFNLECSILPEDGIQRNLKESIYSAEDEALNLFPDGPIKIANIANNHFSQHGPERARYTKAVLLEKNIRIIGENRRPEIITAGNTTIKFWGASLIKDPFFCNEYYLSDYNKILEELCIEEKHKDEIWIISIHWGDEYIAVPSQKQIALAHKLSDLGFDIIAGHHPHVIQTVERYKKSIILYSLGNFIFDQNFSLKTSKGLSAIVKCPPYKNRNEPAMDYYLTYQKQYKIHKISPFNKIMRDTPSYSLYEQRKRMNSLIMRILMKLELLWNIRQGNNQTIHYLLNRGVK